MPVGKKKSSTGKAGNVFNSAEDNGRDEQELLGLPDCSNSFTAGHPMLGEKVACATVSLHSYILSHIKNAGLPATQQLHSDFWDFSDGVCHVMKISLTDNNPDTWHNRHFALAPTCSQRK